MTAIIIHGGAGAYSPGEEHERGLVEAIEAGAAVLDRDGGALDAVEAAVVSMEDNPTFNAGLGSSLSLAGDVEADASVMLSDLSCGAVASLTAAANPIKVARLVMERTDHVLLAGGGADEFARKMGMPPGDLRSPARLKLYEKRLKQLRAGENIKFFPRLRDISKAMDLGTVGAVAIDARGLIAAATSTGGAMMKLPGRVGDSAVIGAGTYANEHGGVSVTGHGEPIIRHVLAKATVDAIAESGSRDGIERTGEWGRRHGVRFGIIGIGADGEPALSFTTHAMSWAVINRGRLSTFLSPS